MDVAIAKRLIKIGCASSVFVASSFLAGSVLAQTPDDYNERIKTFRNVKPLSDEIFGERVDLYKGEISFFQTDVSIPGTGPLLTVGRDYAPGRLSIYRGPAGFSDWGISIPRIVTKSPKGNNLWVVGAPGTNSQARCSQFSSIPLNAASIPADQWWNGYQLITEGGRTQELLIRASANNAAPGNSPASYPIVTSDNWQVSCLPSTSNGVAGEAFLAVSPDGTKYWFDRLVLSNKPVIVTQTMPVGGDIKANIYQAMMLVSRIEDRFGNWLTYNYDGDRLISITASDGRSVAFSWIDAEKIQSITVADASGTSRVWTYNYETATDWNLASYTYLSKLTYPDGSAESFDLRGLYNAHLATYAGYPSCNIPSQTQSANDETYTGSMTHRSGIVGNFSVKQTRRGRSKVPLNCRQPNQTDDFYPVIPADYYAISLVSRGYVGPSVNQAWTYTYGDINASWDSACSSGCATSVTVDERMPDQTIRRSTFSNEWGAYEGKLLAVAENFGSSTAASSVQNYYAPTSGMPYPETLGTPTTKDYSFSNDLPLTTWSPLIRRITLVNGDSYTYQVNTFDAFARPSGVTRSSPWHSRTDLTSYYDDTVKWVLGQVASSSNSDSGVVEQQLTYNANAQPQTISKFGKLQHTMLYNSDGTLATIKDGNGNTTTFSSWKRGIPQFVKQSDGVTESAVVDDNGWISSVTDANGYVTSYSYTAMGLLKSVAYPSSDSTAWNTTTQAFEQVGGTEYGIPAGHWRLTEATGNARKLTYFDALWQPLVTREYDAGNEGGTQRFQRFAYDHEGRVTFSSYPGTSDVLSTGVWTSYDALGRKTSVSQDSELGTLTTLTEYLPGNQTRVTDPRGNKTLAGYQVFDQPAYEAPVWIQHPEGATTEIARDIFGKPTSIRRHDASGSVSLTRSYVYDGYQQLCKTIEPETGASANGYDAAGNVVWTASGLSLPSTTSCDADAAFAAGRRVDRSYDARNRITALTFPDGNGNQRWSYWPDGQVKQITTVNNGISTYNSYAYNKRRLLVGESQGQADGETWAMGYGYDANGHLAAHRYPSGQTIDYAPNALGQPTQAGSYATGVSYYPNGAIKQFTYGNGIVHTLTQNARQLPDTSQDAYGGTAFLSDGYDYDANGNVAAISDGATGRNQRGNRTMAYDGLDRLTSAVSPMFGTATYGYDVLDNLTHVVAPGRDQYYCYDANWQLTNVKTGSCGGSTVIGMSYDPQGNLSNKNGQGFVFDYGNRLRQAIGKETYRYDGNGRRTLAVQSAGNIGSLYDQAGVLRFQKNQRQSKSTDYILLGGSLVAEADWPLGQLASVKDYVNWNPVSGATRYVVEESVDGVTWTSVYDGNQENWTSLARPAGTYSYRVSACTANGNCTAASNVTHDQRSAVDIVPLLYQLLLND